MTTIQIAHSPFAPAAPARASNIALWTLQGLVALAFLFGAAHDSPSPPDRTSRRSAATTRRLNTFYWRRRRESNPCPGFCRPLPEPLGYAAAAVLSHGEG